MTQAFAPIKTKLQEKFGKTIPLVRYQRPITTGAKPRHVLSWTLNPDFADHLGGIYNIKRIENPEIERMVDDYKRQGWARWGNNIYRTDKDHPDAIDLYNAADDYGPEEYITGYGEPNMKAHDLMRKIMHDEQKDREERSREYEAQRKKYILSRNVPLDQVIWATDRANQMEFIVQVG